MIINFFSYFLFFSFLTKILRLQHIVVNNRKIAKEYKIPNKLLTSISLVESGLKKVKILFLGLGLLMYQENLNFLIVKMKQ